MTSKLTNCEHCQTPYHPEKSQSALRFTYCGVLCEQRALGFSIDGLIRSEFRYATAAAGPTVGDDARTLPLEMKELAASC